MTTIAAKTTTAAVIAVTDSSFRKERRCLSFLFARMGQNLPLANTGKIGIMENILRKCARWGQKGERMAVRKHKVGLWLKKHRIKLAPTQIIALTFAAIILTGALLLMLPISSRNGQSCDLITALFTATSATCVTGLVLVDTWTQWSGFGQGVILSMIEVGGLGFMSAAAIVVFMLRRRVGLKQRLVMQQAISAPDMEGVVRLQKWVLFGSLGIQAVGALILFLRFLPEFGPRKAVIWGVFHSISAFCNAGFDIFGVLQAGGSLTPFYNDPVVLLTLAVLILIGSLFYFKKKKWL